LEALSLEAENAEEVVYEKLKAKVAAENEHGTAQWAYSEDPSEANRLILEEKTSILYAAKNSLESKKLVAK